MNVVLIGPGQIGLDLLHKLQQSEVLHCVAVVGKELEGQGLQLAKSMGFNVVSNGIAGLIRSRYNYDLVFDATDANAHKMHWDLLNELGKVVIDLTPSGIGKKTIPNLRDENSALSTDNLNFISCGGQASIPILHAIAKEIKSIEYIEVITTATSQSVGRATRLNIDEYIHTTASAITQYTSVKNVKVMLNVSAAVPPVPFRVIIHLEGKNLDDKRIQEILDVIVPRIQIYAPGYKVLLLKKITDDYVYLSVEVKGQGHYLPESSGNLDIINSAAIHVAEQIAKNKKGI